MSNNKWNWGAFLLCPFWCIRYQVWIGLISIFPFALILLMSLISLCSFDLLVLTLQSKLPSPLAAAISALLFWLIYISGNIFLLIGKNTSMVALILFYTIVSLVIGLKGEKLVIERISKEQNVQKFNSEKSNWLLLGFFLSIPFYIAFFHLTEKLINISIDLVQLPGI